MANITFRNDPVSTVGFLPNVGDEAPDFELVGKEFAPVKLADFAGSKLVLNIFPSVDTGVCAQSVRTFNEKAGALEGVQVVCVSNDLPFAQWRFCGAEGIENVTVGSAFRSTFGDDYGVRFADGPLEGLLSRSVVVIDEDGKVVYTEQVSETGDEPDYEAALAAL